MSEDVCKNSEHGHCWKPTGVAMISNPSYDLSHCVHCGRVKNERRKEPDWCRQSPNYPRTES